MQIGDALPHFKLPTPDGEILSDTDLSNQWSVIYFYPKDNTPGCTKEAIAFSEQMDAFRKLGARVIGVSRDSPRKHTNFIDKHDLKVELISDEDGELCEAFGVWVEKQMYGKTYWGIERSTFLFGPENVCREVWRKVKVSGHVEEVIEKLSDCVNQIE